MSRKVLVVAAHPDDELLGLGGTIARHASNGNRVTIAIIADAYSVRYDNQVIQYLRECTIEAARQLNVTDVRFAGMPDQKLDTLPILDLTQWIEGVLRDLRPHIIYTHFHGDINRDHRVVYEATLTAARPYNAPYVERILCFETASATEWGGPEADMRFTPNVYVDVTDHLESKLCAMSAYATELQPYPHPRSLEALRIRAAHWGSVIGTPAAEPFVLVREVER